MPLLKIFLTPTNTAVISWPASSLGWSPQQSPDLDPTNWVAPPESVNDDRINRFIIVNEGIQIAAPCADDELIEVNEALDKLAATHALQAEVVKLCYFVGMTNIEAGQALGLSERTVKNYWTHARAWLCRKSRQTALSPKSRMRRLAKLSGAIASDPVS